MPAQLGRLLTLEVDSNGSGTYQAIAGLRDRTVTVNNEPVDVTTSNSTNQWRVLLANAGVKTMSVVGSGIFDDETAINTAEGYLRAGTIRNWRITVPGLGVYIGMFQVASGDFSGEYNAAVNYNIGLESSGEVAFTATT